MNLTARQRKQIRDREQFRKEYEMLRALEVIAQSLPESNDSGIHNPLAEAMAARARAALKAVA